MKNADAPGWFASHANIRTDSYVMLACASGTAALGRTSECTAKPGMG